MVVIAAGLGALRLLGDGPRSPEDTVRAFWEAEADDDCHRLVDLVTQRSWGVFWVEGDVEQASRDTVVEACAASDQAPSSGLRAGLDTVVAIFESEDRAVVAVTTTADGDTSSYDIPLQHDDGEWKVDLVELLGVYEDF